MNKKLILLITLLFSSTAFAEGLIYSLEIKKTITIECDAPLIRTDGKVLVEGEIVQFNIFHSTDLKSWLPTDSNVDCLFIVDLTKLANGQHHFTTTAVDSGNRESNLAVTDDPTEKVSFEIQRIVIIERPSHPTGHRTVQ